MPVGALDSRSSALGNGAGVVFLLCPWEERFFSSAFLRPRV